MVLVIFLCFYNINIETINFSNFGLFFRCGFSAVLAPSCFVARAEISTFRHPGKSRLTRFVAPFLFNHSIKRTSLPAHITQLSIQHLLEDFRSHVKDAFTQHLRLLKNAIFFSLRSLLLQVLHGQHCRLPHLDGLRSHPGRRLLRPPWRHDQTTQQRHLELPDRELQADSFSWSRLCAELRRMSIRIVRHCNLICHRWVLLAHDPVLLLPRVSGSRFANCSWHVEQSGVL